MKVVLAQQWLASPLSDYTFDPLAQVVATGWHENCHLGTMGSQELDTRTDHGLLWTALVKAGNRLLLKYIIDEAKKDSGPTKGPCISKVHNFPKQIGRCIICDAESLFGTFSRPAKLAYGGPAPWSTR